MEVNLPVTAVLAADSLLGEGALWDEGRGIVWFVDIKRRRLWHFDPSNGSNGFAEAPEQIGWALPAEGGLLLCGLKDGLYTFAPETDTFTKLCAVPGEPATNRLNDACTDPWGRVWFGSMDDSESAASGRFYVFDRGSIRAEGPSGIAITNGPAVNASGTRIYFTDTIAQNIMVADLSAQGVGEARLFADTGTLFTKAYPDGPVVDAEDHVWTGLYHGSCVARFSPDGQLVATVPIPARDITKMAFGGPDFRTAYVTSATKNMSLQDMAQMPQAGSLFAFAAPVAGFAQPRVKLS
ncbi:MAG: SMP-30/gluconolactonase/LRE family protein [Porphyrobacter sp. IPPAS B-1204]|nr:MAG: SMP-30/gluconolactonase/LRE family protein [Porphyrobacter sp. IPPAS B-1204]